MSHIPEPLSLTHPDGKVLVAELSEGRRRITAVPADSKRFMLRAQWNTCYSVDLIRHVLAVKGPTGVCDEIMRDEDPAYVQRRLVADLLAYFDQRDLSSRARVLDFGCGCGASTAVLARLLPDAEIVGVDLEEDLLALAQRRMEFHHLTNVTFRRSPGGAELPAGMGRFDLIVLSGVFEHLLPEERKTLVPQLWSAVADGGSLFIDQAPNRLFPLELHTTRLPIINYLPARLTLELARRFSKRVEPRESWDQLLRRGIRGASVREVMRLLPEDGAVPVLLEPTNQGLRDRIDLWYHTTNPERMRAIKSAVRVLMKALKLGTGIVLVPDLTLAIRKPASVLTPDRTPAVRDVR